MGPAGGAPFQIEPEIPSDAPAVGEVVAAAFGQPDEARLVAALRASHAAKITLVARVKGALVGHVMFSAMRAPERSLGLAPVSVRPAWQGRGVGSALIRAGLAQAVTEGWRRIFVLGDPAYYGRFGFSAGAAAGFASAFAGPHFMALDLADGVYPASGDALYDTAFDALS